MSESLTLYSHPYSQPGRSVEFFLRVSNIQFEYHLVKIPEAEYLTEWFTSLNPYQTVPLLIHGEYRLWESVAIISYLADTFAVDNEWYPKDIKTRGRIHAYLHWHHQGCRNAICGYIRPKFIDPKFLGGPELTPELEVPLKARFDEFFENFAWIIRETGYAARTPRATIADIFAYSEISQTVMIQLDLSAYPEIKAWYDKIGEIEIVGKLHEQLRGDMKRYYEAVNAGQ